MEIRAEGLNQALVLAAKAIYSFGDVRTVRGQKVMELTEPTTIIINNPKSRNVLIEARNWNPFLPWLESLWIGQGMNDLSKGPGKYVKSLYEFSDDNQSWRAGYGPRIRRFDGAADNFVWSYPIRQLNEITHADEIDQLKWVLDLLRKDPATRQAVITIANPAKDCYIWDDFNYAQNEPIVTKDMPCTRSLQFMVTKEGELDLVVYMRSNDLIWGLSAVNVPNFTIMQEYVAWTLGLKVGTYYHVAANLHAYDRHSNLLQTLSAIDPTEALDWDLMAPIKNEDPPKANSHLISPIIKLDQKFNELSMVEHWDRPLIENVDILRLHDDFWGNWMVMLYFANPKSPIQALDPEIIRNNQQLREIVKRILEKRQS